MFNDLKKLIESIESKYMNLNTYIIVHRTQLENGKTMKDKIQEKFNVLVTEVLDTENMS